MSYEAGLWAAESHQYGKGKVHIIKASEPTKTLCGNRLKVTPGRYVNDGEVTCIGCRRCEESQREQAERASEYEAKQQEFEQERERKNAEWWAGYTSYLESPAWREKSAAVLRRAGGLCEGCGIR